MHAPRASVGSVVGAPRVIVNHVGVQDYLRFHRQPVAVLPYPWFIDTPPIGASPVENATSADPYVIVIAAQPHPAPVRASPETPPDYSYVAGCRAIPNGYHCDTAHNGTP